MMMNKALAFVVLACIWQYGECTIPSWSAPSITTPTGTGTHAVLLNDGHTNSVTGITIAAATDDTISAYAVVSSDPSTLTWAITAVGVLSLSSGTVTYSTGTTAIKLLVSVTDGDGTVTATVMIDINVAPTITAHDNTACIPDQSGAGVDLIDLAATDANTGQTMTWAIPTGNTGTDFEITTSGIVQVASGKTTAIGTTAVYTLVITASDSSDTPLTATTTVTGSVRATCGGSAAITLSFMTILAALIVTKLS